MVSVNSLLDNFKEKVTNPFFGTFIVVWLIRNWDLVYTLFNFEEKTSLYNKKKFISEYYVGKNLFWEFITNFAISLGLLIIGYVFVIISRMIVNVVYHNIIPYFNSKFVSKLVVSKNRFDTVKKDRDEYVQRLLDIDEERISLEQKNTLLKNANIEYESKINSLNTENETLLFDKNTIQNQNISMDEDIKVLKESVAKERERKLLLEKSYSDEIAQLKFKNDTLRDDKLHFQNLLRTSRNIDALYPNVNLENLDINKPYTVDFENHSLAINLKIPQSTLDVGFELYSLQLLKMYYNSTKNYNKDTLQIFPELSSLQLEQFMDLKLIEKNGTYTLTPLGVSLHFYKPYFDLIN